MQIAGEFYRESRAADIYALSQPLAGCLSHELGPVMGAGNEAGEGFRVCLCIHQWTEFQTVQSHQISLV